MNLEKVVFGFFVLLAATLNFGFFVGDISDPEVHNSWELFLALVVALITTVLKFGDSTQLGAVHLPPVWWLCSNSRQPPGCGCGPPRSRPPA